MAKFKIYYKNGKVEVITCDTVMYSHTRDGFISFTRKNSGPETTPELVLLQASELVNAIAREEGS